MSTKIPSAFIISDDSEEKHFYPLSEVNNGADTRDPKRVLVEQEEKDHGIYYPKLHPVPTRVHGNLPPNTCASPKSPHQFIFPYNGSSTVLHATTQAHHPLEALRRLHHSTPIQNSSCSYSVPQRSSHTPSPQNPFQGQITSKTPETPASPRLVSLSSPPPSSPVTIVGGGRGPQTNTHYPHSVIVGGSPVSPSPSSSPSVINMNSVSPRQRSRHPSTSLSPFSEGGGSSVGQLGSNFSQRKKSSSSTPHSPASGGSPNPSPLFPKYKLEDILEQFKNSGNSSTNNHHLLIPINTPLLSNQSSNTCAVSSKPSNSTMSPSPSSGPPNFDVNSAGPSSLPPGAFLNQHHSHQSKLSNTPSFPASTLLSAAAKAQLANQITQAQNSNVASKPVRMPSLEMLKEGQQPSSQVINSTLINSHTFPTIRPPNPSLASASSILLPSSQSLAQSLPHLPATVERSALHRKRHRRSPTVLGTQKDPQHVANGLSRTPPTDAISATAINLSTSSSIPSQLHSSSTSAVQNQSAVMLENHLLLHPGQAQRLPAPRQIAQLCRPPRQNEALDFTTHVTTTPLGLDPPTQPLSALLHLLSVQNAQAASSVASSAPAQLVSVSNEENGHTNKQSPRLSPSSPSSHSNLRHQKRRSPCSNNNTNPPSSGSSPFPSSLPQQQSPPPSSPLGLLQTQLHPQSAASSPPQRSCASTLLPNTNVALPNSSGASGHVSPPPSDKRHLPTVGCVSHHPLQEASAHDTVIRGTGVNSMSAAVDPVQSHGGVALAVSSSPKPLDLSNHVLALLAASSTVPQGEGSSNLTSDVVMSSQESSLAGKDIFQHKILTKNRFMMYLCLHHKGSTTEICA